MKGLVLILVCQGEGKMGSEVGILVQKQCVGQTLHLYVWGQTMPLFLYWNVFR